MLKVLFAIPIIYLLLLLFLFLFQRNMTYYPTTLSEIQKINSGPYSQINVDAHDGIIIKSWIANDEEDKKTFLFFHGNAGNAADRMPMMRVLVNEGHTVVLAEYRGFGDNPGAPNEKDIISDGEKLMEYLLSSGVSETDIVLMGRSLGTGVATNLATKYGVFALVLISPYSSFPDVAANIYPYFPVRFLMHDQFDSKSIISNITAPIQMFHGDLDRVIPIKFGKALFNAANEPKIFKTLSGRGHNNLDMDQINFEVLTFLQENS